MGKKQKRQEEEARVAKSKFHGFICVIIAISIFVGNKNMQEAIAANKKLAAWIQSDTNCPELNWDADDVADGCYWWTSNFEITANITDNDMNAAILPETMNCKNIVYDRWVDKYMTFDKHVCPGDPNYQRSNEAEGKNPKLSWKKKHDQEVQAKIFAAQGPKAKVAIDKPKPEQEQPSGKSDGECHMQTVTDWGHHAESGWEFPSNNNADQGHQTVWSSPAQHALKPVNGTSNFDLHFNFATFENSMEKISTQHAIGSIFALAGDGFQVINPIEGTFYSDPSLEAERFNQDNAPLCWEVRVDTYVGFECTNSYPLCFSDSGIQHWTSTSPATAGLTTAEFQALPYYGNTTDFPSCYTNPTEGDYRVRSYCRGDAHNDVFVIADIKKETVDSNDYLTVNVIKRDQFPDTEAGLEVAFFNYQQNAAGLTKDQVITDYVKVLDEIAGASQEFANSTVGFFGIIGLLMMGAKAKKISSSSS